MNAPSVETAKTNNQNNFERLIYPSASPSVLTEEGLNELAKIDTEAFHFARLAAIVSDVFEDEKLLEKLESLVPVLKNQIDVKGRLVLEYKAWIREKGYVQKADNATDQTA